MIIGLPKETLQGETRIALLPSEIKKSISDHNSFKIETGAGLGAYFSDDAYTASGAEVVQDTYSNSHMIISVVSLFSTHWSSNL